jgi:hypothetical protein
VSYHFNGKVKHASRRSENRSAAANRRTERATFCDLSRTSPSSKGRRKLLKNNKTGNEAWIFGYDVETKRQSSQWIWKPSPRPKTARQVRSNLRVMLIIFFGYEGVVRHQFVPKGQRVNKEFYLEVTFARIDKEKWTES